MIRVLVIVVFALLAVRGVRAFAQGSNPRDAHISQVIPFGEAGGTGQKALTMDYYAPAGAGPHPAVVIIHGGGFTGGTSRNGSEAYCADFLAPAGYAVFSINYRLAPGATFAEMVADVQEAVRFLRKNAEQYGVDPEKIVLLGGSAGGYLSNMAGLISTENKADRVAAVVTLYGISDLRTMPAGNSRFVERYGLIGRGTPTAAELAAASPITHVKAGEPPFLLIHGDKDEAVPFAQSVKLMEALRGAGDKADLITIPGGPHATGSWHTIAGVPDWEREMVEWLNGVVGHEGAVGAGIAERTAK